MGILETLNLPSDVITSKWFPLVHYAAFQWREPLQRTDKQPPYKHFYRGEILQGVCTGFRFFGRL